MEFMKKASSKEQLHTNTELKRYLGALHEDQMDALKGLGEQFVDVNRKLDSHTEMIGGLSVRMTSVEQMIGHMEMNIAVMQEDIGFIKSGMKRKVDQDEFEALIRRVSVLEKRVLK